MSKMFEFSNLYKPFFYPYAVDLTVEHERMHWHEGELDLSDDVSDWKLPGRLTDSEKNFITQILRMFTTSDVNVGEFYVRVLIPLFKNNEIVNMLNSFVTREGTHQRAYALLNDTLGLPEGDYAAFLQYKEMAEKDEFMRDADPSTRPGLARALAKATFNEGVSLFASFVMLLNFQRRGRMKGMGKVVEWSVKDETKHVEGVTWLFKTLCAEYPRVVTDKLKSDVYQMAVDCVALEDAFIDLAYEMGPVEGVTVQEVKDYIRFIANRRLNMLGLKDKWPEITSNPLPWVDLLLNAADHTNFFENKVAEYEVGSLEGEWDYAMSDYRVYGRDGCEFCEKATDLLDMLSVSYECVDLTDTVKRQAFYDERGFDGNDRTVPKIYRLAGDAEEYIGGYSSLEQYLSLQVA